MTEPRRRRVLSGRYELDRVLGAGGMATVYLARDRVLDRQVAVKVLGPPHAQDPASVERFRAEARTAARLCHPNVVEVFDAGSDDGVHYLVMEHLPGPTLAELLRRQGPLPPPRVAELAIQVCGALTAAHAHGVVHRDVKPGNLLLTHGGRVKVADFGIAKATAAPAMTGAGVVIGSPAYMAPEQVQGEPVDARSDVYALGCVLHELLTGAPPFGSAGDSSPVAVALRQVSQAPEPPSRRNPRVGPGLDKVVLTAMAKRPGERYPSARALGDDLARVLAGDVPTAGAPTGPLPVLPAGTGPLPVLPAGTGPLRTDARRPRPARWALLASIVVALVAALLVALGWPHGAGAPAARAEATPTTGPVATSLPGTTAPPTSLTGTTAPPPTVTARPPSPAHRAGDADGPGRHGHRKARHAHNEAERAPAS